MNKVRSLVALGMALALGGWLLTMHPTTGSLPESPSPPLASASSLPATLSDGSEFTPLFYADATTSIGTATDGTDDLLVLRRPAAPDRELRHLPKERFAQFLGLTAAAGALFWAESSARPDGTYETRLWRAPLDGAAPPTSLTADTGAAVFFDSEYDLVVADGRVHWVAATPDDAPRTELRSVAVTGGPVTTTRFDGRFRHTAWPWLVSVDDQAPLTLADPLTNERRTVTRAAAESVVCTPTWCRSMIDTGDRHRFDVRHPDGTARRRVPGDLTAVTIDTAIAGHYELFTDFQNNQTRLLAYDLDTSAFRVLATDVGVTAARAGVVWWADHGTWKSVDLR